MRRRDVLERFWEKVDVSGDCWVWTAGVFTHGYGGFATGRRTMGAHRFAFETSTGIQIPDDLGIDHICHDPSVCFEGEQCPHRRCVNPAHMILVSNRENVLRGNGPTARNALLTHCPRGHPYSGSNLRITVDGYRACRACHRLHAQRYRDERKAAA